MTNAKGSKSARKEKSPTPTLVEVRCAQDGCDETTVMPFRRAAKGTHRCSEHAPKPPAEGGKPEVTLENGTVATPNPADAPPPPRKSAGRKRKAEPRVATKTEVPEWAKRAAAHNTPADMAAVPDAAPAPEAAAPAPAPKKRHGAKPAKPNPATNAAPAAAPGSLRAVGAAWIDSLRADGHSVSTVASYGNDLGVAYEVLGADIAAEGITAKQIAAFDRCKAVLTKRNGKPKAQPTILKTRRALRLALTWAVETKLIKQAPYPAA
jgi:hypothetical protein